MMERPVSVTPSYRVYKKEHDCLRRCPGCEAGGYKTQRFEQTRNNFLALMELKFRFHRYAQGTIAT